MPSDDLRQSENTAPRRGLRVAGIVAAVVVVVVVASGIGIRAADDSELRDWTNEHAIASVAVVSPTTEGDGATLELPGRLEALSRAPLYARVSGYLKSWKVDIGSPVKAGQLLAEIEAPDVEQQLLQAKADLASAQANAALAASTAKRWQSMLGGDSVSKQEVDEKVGDLAAKEALVNAERANVERLRTMQGFTRIVAPFDGVVTARDTDVGALISAGGGAGPELFEISDIRRLRVYVNAPQVYAGALTPGTKAEIAVPDRPGKKYTGTIESASGAVNVATGTTLVQLSVDNADGELLPGGFANVTFQLAANANVLRVPASALIFDQGGLRVATVVDDKVVIKPITIARDNGSTIEVASGLEASDRVIESPPDGVSAGDTVHIVNTAAPKAADATPASGKSGNAKS